MKDRLTNNIGLKLAALLFAVLLWVTVVNIEDPISEENYRGIPVKVLNEYIFTAQGMTYRIVEGNETVNVTVRAKRTVISDIKSSDIYVTADVKYRVSNSISEAVLPIKVEIRGFDEDDYEVVVTPENIQIEVEANETKKFPVSVVTVGTPRDGYVLENVTPNPSYITFAGAESRIRRIEKVVAKADVSGISSSGTVEAELILYDENDKIIDQSLMANNLGHEGLKVDIQVLKTKTIPVEFDQSEIITAPGYALAGVEYEPQKIVVAGKDEDLAEISKLIVPSSALKCNDLKQSKDIEIDVKKYLPEGIRMADVTMGQTVVTISVEKFGTKAFSIPVGSIFMENVLSGVEASFATTENVELEIQGSKAGLELLSGQPMLKVDMEGYTKAGVYEVPVKVEGLPVGCSLVNPVSVQIVVTEK